MFVEVVCNTVYLLWVQFRLCQHITFSVLSFAHWPVMLALHCINTFFGSETCHSFLFSGVEDVKNDLNGDNKFSLFFIVQGNNVVEK